MSISCYRSQDSEPRCSCPSALLRGPIHCVLMRDYRGPKVCLPSFHFLHIHSRSCSLLCFLKFAMTPVMLAAYKGRAGVVDLLVDKYKCSLTDVNIVSVFDVLGCQSPVSVSCPPCRCLCPAFSVGCHSACCHLCRYSLSIPPISGLCELVSSFALCTCTICTVSAYHSPSESSVFPCFRMERMSSTLLLHLAVLALCYTLHPRWSPCSIAQPLMDALCFTWQLDLAMLK